MTDSLQALVRNRLELFAVEWQEEKLRLIRLLGWLALAGVLGSAGMLIALGALACWLWGRAGYPGVIGLVVACLVAAAFIVFTHRANLRRLWQGNELRFERARLLHRWRTRA